MRANHAPDRAGSVAVVCELEALTEQEIAIVEERDH